MDNWKKAVFAPSLGVLTPPCLFMQILFLAVVMQDFIL